MKLENEGKSRWDIRIKREGNRGIQHLVMGVGKWRMW